MAASIQSEQTLVKQPGESKLYGCDFSGVLQGSAILTDTPSVPTAVELVSSDLTISSVAVASGSLIINARIASGTDSTYYTVAFTALDDAQNTHIIDCLLSVVD